MDRTAQRMKRQSTASVDTSFNSHRFSPTTNGLPKSTRRKYVSVLKDFTSYTSLHGFTHISCHKGVRRRACWVAITLFAIGLLLYQMGNSIELYFSRPVTFNVQRSYGRSLIFPAVTICNQNLFRISMAWRQRIYDDLEVMYKEDRGEYLASQASNRSMIGVFHQLKHLKEDLMLSCSWNRVNKCSAANFTETLVEDYVCYTFNSDREEALMTSVTGSGSGLNIRLNIEQYEFMRTNSLTAGVHVYIHDQNSVPREVISVPPGMKAHIRVGRKHVQLLRDPYGVCGDARLHHYDTYSNAACLSECHERFIAERCDCRTGLLGRKVDIPLPTCSIQNYTTCVVKKLAQFTAAEAQCACPVECEHFQFENFVSFSQISTFEIGEAVKHLPNDTSAKLQNAREVFFRLNSDKRHKTVNQTLIPFLNITNIVHANILNLQKYTTSMQKDIKVLEKQMKVRFKFHKYMLDRAVYAVKHNLGRLWTVADERSFTLLTFDYVSLLFSFGVLETLSRRPQTSPATATAHRITLDIKLREKQKMCKRALASLRDIHEAFSNSTSFLIYQVTPDQFYDKEFQPSKLGQVDEQQERTLYSTLRRYILELSKSLQDLRDFLDRFAKRRSPMRHSELHRLKLNMAFNCRRVNNYLYLYQDRIVNEAFRSISNLQSQFFSASKEAAATFLKVNYRMRRILSLLSSVDALFVKSLTPARSIARRYIADPASLRFNLTSLSRRVVRGHLGRSVQALTSDLTNVETHRVAMDQELWTLRRSLQRSIAGVFASALSGPYAAVSRDLRAVCRHNASGTRARSAEFARMETAVLAVARTAIGGATCNRVLSDVNADWMGEGEAAVVRAVTAQVEVICRTAALVDAVTRGREELAFHAAQLHEFAVGFLDRNRISRKFVRDNFVELQVFYQDLVTLHEFQSPAYTMTQLWSDFGGNFGLLLGASVLSIVEILDFFLLGIYRIHA